VAEYRMTVPLSSETQEKTFTEIKTLLGTFGAP